MLDEAYTLPADVHDLRLGLEISIIQRLARTLGRRLQRCDPLSERVHLGKGELLAFTLAAVAAETARRAAGQHPQSKSVAGA